MPAAFPCERYLACDAQRERSGCHIVWCFGDGYNVVPSLRPIDIPHGHPVLLRHLLECFCPLGRVLRVANSLIREARKGDVGWHGCPPSTDVPRYVTPTREGRHSGGGDYRRPIPVVQLNRLLPVYFQVSAFVLGSGPIK